MTPVEQVQQWLTATGETYDPAKRETLLWEALRKVQAAMHAYHQAIFDLHADPTVVGNYFAHKDALLNIARELCDLAYVAIGTALLSGRSYDTGEGSLAPWGLPYFDNKHAAEGHLYTLFQCPENTACLRMAAAFYGIGDKLEACFAEVHRANMDKVPECGECFGKGVEPADYWEGGYTMGGDKCRECEGTGRIINRDATGRIIKPDGWRAPDLGKILFGEEGV